MSSLIISPSALLHPADVIEGRGIGHGTIAGTKVLLINMPLRESGPPVNFPQGPLLLATNLRQNYGVDATIIDLNAYRVQDKDAQRRGLPGGRHLTEDETRGLVFRHITKYEEPTLVGFSGKITTLRWQQTVARIIRGLLPDVFLVSGNGLATELKTGLFQYIPELDGVCSSEGDDIIVKIVYDAKLIRETGLASAINSGKLAPYHIGNIRGRERFFYLGNRPRNLDSLPFADLDILAKDVDGEPVRDHYLNMPLYGKRGRGSSTTPWEDGEVTPKTNSVSSRGCPYACTYCFRGANGERNWTVRSAEHVFRELADYKERYSIKMHGFHDDNFAVSSKRIADMVPLLGPLGVKWGALARLDEISGIMPDGAFESPLRIENMAKAGCVFIGFGPESASPSVLTAIGKGGHTLLNGMTEVLVDGVPYSFPRSEVEGIRNCLRVGIHANCTWIVGSPSETLEDVKTTVRFIRWQIQEYERHGTPSEAINQAAFSMTWYPGTMMVNNPKVRSVLSNAFGLNFVPIEKNSAGTLWEPETDENLYRYLAELDDATKVLYHPKSGKPLHFSEMSDAQFLQVRRCIDEERLFDILSL